MLARILEINQARGVILWAYSSSQLSVEILETRCLVSGLHIFRLSESQSYKSNGGLLAKYQSQP